VSKALETRCLIIGNGIAGLSAAVALADRGIDTLVITAAPNVCESNTVYAQGGIIFESRPADPQGLIDDIMEAGAHANYRPAVEQLAKLGPALVKEILIDKTHVAFDANAQGVHSLTREGGHGESRILHRGDESGKSIEDALLGYCREKKSLRILPGTSAVNLLMNSFHSKERSERYAPAHCFGAFVFDQETQEVYPIYADHTIIATGGVGQLYQYNTNSKFARGDGIALAYRAGCRLENLEYLQFHPTTFFHPKAPRFLISEALRGEGAVFLNQAGERFMAKRLPTFPIPELAPRDKVAKAIHEEMLSSGALSVFLDISHRPADWIRERFPFIHRTCLQYDIDITKQPIPVVPGAHYHCGGIWSDLEGRTTVPRLWAAGEVACTGLHGANRLASTSLLEGLVWGTRAGRGIAEAIASQPALKFPAIEPWKHETVSVDASFLSQDWQTLKQTMWNYVGLIKTDARLTRAEGILHELRAGIEVFYRKAVLSDQLIGLRHAALAATLILKACKRNPRSHGCYLREEWEI